MKLDPTLALAMNMHAGPGVYALLLGSGVSRSAGVPTGWDVVLDLIRQVAKLERVDCDPDPAAWYRSAHGGEPDYAELLDQLTSTPDQRQLLLRDYFEPTPDERERGMKLPTAAHRAIAQLVVGGRVRVILTTNFDRLTETAIADAGVTPVVLSTPAAMAGAAPLTHQRCLVVKLHGDYTDPRLLNTPAELARYKPAVRKYLKRIVDEFGLIVSGWSAEYDVALRDAIAECPTRRYGFNWIAVGDPADDAARLIANRAGTLIRVAGADAFFADLAAKVSALDDVYPDHPATAAAAVALVTRYVATPGQHVRLHDLIMRETDRTLAECLRIDERVLSHSRIGQGVTGPQQAAAAEGYIAATGTLRRTLATAAYWGGGGVVPVLAKSLARLAVDPTPRPGGVSRFADPFRLFPGLLATYAVGIGYMANGQVLPLAEVMTSTIVKVWPAAPWRLLIIMQTARPGIDTLANFLPAGAGQREAFSVQAAALLEPETVELFADSGAFDRAFDDFELLASMLTAYQRDPRPGLLHGSYRMGSGRFAGWFSQTYDPVSLWPGHTPPDKLGDWARAQAAFGELVDGGYFGREWDVVTNLLRAAQEAAAGRLHGGRTI